MKKDQILGLIRHLLTFAGGVIVARGYGSDAIVGELIGGAMTIIGGLWSILAPEKQP